MKLVHELNEKLLKLCMSSEKALAKKDVAKITRELIEQGADVDCATSMGHRALYLACRENHLSIVQELLRAGAKPDKGDRSGMTPLHLASQNGHLGIAKALIAAGANMEAANDFGETPIFRACTHGNTDIGIELIKAGCSLQPNKKSGIAPLDYLGAEAISNWYDSWQSQAHLEGAFQECAASSNSENPKKKGMSL